MEKIAALATLAALLSVAEAKADDSYEQDNMIAAEAGLQDNNLQNGYDFTEGWQIGLNGEGAIDICTDMQLALGGSAGLAVLSYSDGGGHDRKVSVDASLLFEWAPRWETAAFNLGAGVHFDFMNENAVYEGIPLDSRIIGAGPMIHAFVGSEWVYAGLNFSTAFGVMGNNVQQYNDLVQYNLGLKLGFHFGPVDLEGYARGEYNTAMQDAINRENIFVNAGLNARFWVAEHLGLTAGYNYLWAYGDTDHVEGNAFNAGLAVRF